MIHPAIAHDLEMLIAGWLLSSVVLLIAYGVRALRDDIKQAAVAPLKRCRRHTAEPTRVTLIDRERPVLFDQDVTA